MLLTPRARLGALAGIGAPVCFIGGWLVAGAQTEGYSPVEDFISDLARVGAPTRPLMTAGFLGFGVLAALWAGTIASALEAPLLRLAIGTAALGTVAVSLLPLGASFGDVPHAVAAGTSYIAMASTPLIAGRALSRQRKGRLAAASYLTGAASAVLLVGSTIGGYEGALQRAGLGVVDAWYVAFALRELRRR